MSATSTHLKATAKAVRSGAHVVLRGHLRDEVLLAGEIVVERWALARILVEQAGIRVVVAADEMTGLHCVVPDDREVVEQALSAPPKAHDGGDRATATPRLGRRKAIDVAAGALALMRQQTTPMAVILDDLDLLVDPGEQQGRSALSLLRRAVDEAAICDDGSPAPPRNVLVVIGTPDSHAAADLAALPGVRTVDATAPDRSERAVALGSRATGFFGVEEITPAVTYGLDRLADVTHGWSLRDYEQLRRLSHDLEIPPTRPGTLMASMPSRPRVSPILRVGVDALAQTLEESVVGQPAAMAQLRAALAQAERPSALRPPAAPPTRPLMTAVMFGPSGVGKTEVARTLARALFGSERALVRVDCAELQGPHDISRLTGAPPGYVGHESGGVLSEPLRRRPGSVVLFDEFEKADKAFGELLLAILDDGRLTDGRGATVSFGDAIVLITTNLGSEALKDLIDAGLPSTPALLGESAKIAKERLSKPPKGRPELWSRLEHAMVGFDVLRRDVLPDLVEKYCRQLEANLADELDFELAIDHPAFVDPCYARLGRGHDDPDGHWDGRAVAHQIRTLVEGPLRDQLAELDRVQPLDVTAGDDGFAVARPTGELEAMR